MATKGQMNAMTSAAVYLPADQSPRPFNELVKERKITTTKSNQRTHEEKKAKQTRVNCEGNRPLRASRPVNTLRDCKCLH